MGRPNKGMTQAKPQHNGASQLIPGVDGRRPRRDEGVMTESEEWHPAGTEVRGLAGWLMVAWAVSFHVLSLRWLRATAWKNRVEAKGELQRLLSEHQALSYEAWVARLGQIKRIEFTCASGHCYQATVEPLWDDAPQGAVRVLVSIDDGGVGAYHPLTESLLIQPPARRHE